MDTIETAVQIARLLHRKVHANHAIGTLPLSFVLNRPQTPLYLTNYSDIIRSYSINCSVLKMVRILKHERCDNAPLLDSFVYNMNATLCELTLANQHSVAGKFRGGTGTNKIGVNMCYSRKPIGFELTHLLHEYGQNLLYLS